MIMPLLPACDIAIIKNEIDTNQTLLYKFFITMTWAPKTITQMVEKLENDPRTNKPRNRHGIVPLEAWKVNQFHHYFIRLAKRTDSHLQAYGALNPEWENHHFHAVLLSNNPIELTTIRTTWDCCLPTAKNARHYRPDGGAVGYIFGGHYGILNQGRVYCPGVKSSCRNGNCSFIGGEVLKRSA